MQSISSQNVVDLLLDAVCVVQRDSTIEFVSPAFERIFGYRPDEVIGKRMLDMVHPDDVAMTAQQAQRVTEGHLQLQFENRYLRKDGSVAHVRWTARWLPEQQVRLAVAHDITERKFTESMQAAIYAISEAAHATQNLQALFRHIHEIVGKLLPASHFAVALYDAAHDALSFPYLASASDDAAPHVQVRNALCTEVIRSGNTVLLTPHAPATLEHTPLPQDGPPQHWLGAPLPTLNGPIGALVLRSDGGDRGRYTEKDKELLQFVSTQVAAAIERKQMHQRLEHMAQYDQLTHLPNRQLFLDRLRMALSRARRDQGLLSLLFIDLDGFKQVNDTLGHAMGDLLLQRVAQRLQGCVRDSDTVARLGGDEFVVLLEGGQALTVAEKILASFGQPFDLDGVHLHVQPSIGIANHPDHGSEADHLLGHADAAMYLAKKSGGNRVHTAPGGDSGLP